MELMQITKKDFQFFLTKLVSQQEVIGVVRKGKHFVFDLLEKAGDLCLDYDQTILPPKKFLLPVQDTLLTYKTKDATSYKEVYDQKPRVIVGIHPGDMAAIALLDKAFNEGQSDGHYLCRRENTTLIGSYPTVAFPYRFTNSMIQDDAYKAADLFIIDMGDSFGLEVITEKGKKLAAQMEHLVAETADLKEKIAAGKNRVADPIAMPVSRQQLPEFLKSRDKHPEWKRRAERCFSCGSCVLVCPTCYCFDVKDEVELSLQQGERRRVWDGCLLEKFATVAGNHNFRQQASDRFKHRLYRKGQYLQERFGLSGCVGCGRCAQACVAKIASPVEVVEALKQ